MKKHNLEIIIGWECNNNCIFCSNRSLRDLCKERGISTISFEEIKNILKSHNSKDIANLFFVGGEPTIRKDFFKIIKFAKKGGYSNISIQTNGRMFKNFNFARKVCKEGLNIGFSIHGDSALLHDTLTKSPDSFEQLVSGMKNLKSLGQTFTTNTTINKINYKRIPEIITFLSKYNPSSILFSLVSPIGNTKDNLKNILPPINNLKSIIEKSVLIAKKLNQNIKFTDVPICIMDKYEDYMYEKNFELDRKIIVKEIKDFFYLENKNENEKEKPLICSNCKRNEDCFGIWKGYLDLYGDKGLNNTYMTKNLGEKLKVPSKRNKKEIMTYDETNILKKFDKHKTIFNIRDDSTLTLFRKLIDPFDESSRLECSIKFREGEIYSERYNLSFDASDNSHIQKSLSFFEELDKMEDIKINSELIKRRFKKFIPFSRNFIIGLDLRTKHHKESRLKYWFESNDFLVGWDTYYADGYETKKKYLLVKPGSEIFLRIEEDLGEFFIDLANSSEEITFRKDKHSQIHFKILDRKKFISLINNKKLNKFLGKFDFLKSKINYIGFFYDELKNRDIKNFNLYY